MQTNSVKISENKVYILTASEQDNIIVFGNDYLLTFDQDNHLLTKKEFHQNILSANYGELDGQEIEESMHSHSPETGDFITATDICTLLLYEKIANWRQHIVVSKKYLNFWNCKKNELFILPVKTFDKITKDNEKRKTKSKSEN